MIGRAPSRLPRLWQDEAGDVVAPLQGQQVATLGLDVYPGAVTLVANSSGHGDYIPSIPVSVTVSGMRIGKCMA